MGHRASLTTCRASTLSPSSASSEMSSPGLLVSKNSSLPARKPAPSQPSSLRMPLSARRSGSLTSTSGKASRAEGWSVRTLQRHRSASDSCGSSKSRSTASISSCSSSSSSPSGAATAPGARLVAVAGGSAAARARPPSLSSSLRAGCLPSSSEPAGERPRNLRREA